MKPAIQTRRLPALLLATHGWARDPKAHALPGTMASGEIRADWRIVHIRRPSRPKETSK